MYVCISFILPLRKNLLGSKRKSNNYYFAFLCLKGLLLERSSENFHGQKYKFSAHFLFLVN